MYEAFEHIICHTQPNNLFSGDVASNFLKCKNLFEAAFDTLVRVSSVWYNNLGNDQKSIQKSLDELFQDEVESDEDKWKRIL